MNLPIILTVSLAGFLFSVFYLIKYDDGPQEDWGIIEGVTFLGGVCLVIFCLGVTGNL